MDKPQIYCRVGLQSKRDTLSYLDSIVEKTEWEENEMILDAGCGPGDTTTYILLPYVPPCSTVVGCDVSKEMIVHASHKFENERVSFKYMDIQYNNIWTDWKEETFNKIFSFYVMHWIRNKRRAAKNFLNLLKPGGELYLMFLAEYPVHTAINEIYKDEQWRPYLQTLAAFPETNSVSSALEYSTVLKELGFKNVDVKIKNKTYCYQNLDAIMLVTDSLSPSSIPDNKRTLYLESIKRVLLENNLIKVNPMNGKVTTEYITAEVYAKK